MFMMFIYAIHAYLTKTFHIIKHIESIGNENKKSSLFIRCICWNWNWMFICLSCIFIVSLSWCKIKTCFHMHKYARTPHHSRKFRSEHHSFLAMHFHSAFILTALIHPFSLQCRHPKTEYKYLPIIQYSYCILFVISTIFCCFFVAFTLCWLALYRVIVSMFAAWFLL